MRSQQDNFFLHPRNSKPSTTNLFVMNGDYVEGECNGRQLLHEMIRIMQRLGTATRFIVPIDQQGLFSCHEIN